MIFLYSRFTLLKILQKYGKLEKFDFLYNKTGPDIGKPRGYCFITYDKIEQSQKAMKCLNGKLALNKRLQVRWAHASKQVSFQQVNLQNSADKM
jgi:RNA recognition motif-containing protein